MTMRFKKLAGKLAKITGISIGSLLLLLFLLPYFFPDTIENKIKDFANSSINGKIDFSKVRLSFFNHFPALTLTMYDVSLKGSAPFANDTLIAADELAFGIDISSLFEKQLRIDQFFLTHANINVLVDAAGAANYNVYKGDTSTSINTDTTSTSLKIEKIVIENSHLIYNDQSLPMRINAKGFNYTGKGDLSKDIFDLYTHAAIDSLDFSFDNEDYVLSKKINADLITAINTNSLRLEFQKNDLRINKLPVQFNGVFEFLKNGYKMDFNINSKATPLYDLFTALPPKYLGWLQKTEVDGTADVIASLTGNYIAETITMPSLLFNLKIRDGAIAYDNAPVPVNNIFLNFDAALPGLNTDSLLVNIDSLYFNVDKDYCSSILHIKGLNNPFIQAKLNASLNLETWDKALGLAPYDLKGRFTITADANGKYATTIIPKAIRGFDTILTSIPVFHINSSLQNGFIKYEGVPQPINNISFQLNASCADSNYKHAALILHNLHAQALHNEIKGNLQLSAASDMPLELNIQTLLNLADIKKFYPLDSMELAGKLSINLQSKGKYNPEKKLFPVTTAKINLTNGSIKTAYYPHPVQKIQVQANLLNTNGTLKDLALTILPISFEFEGQPFSLQANLKNFDDLQYNINAAGKLDMGKIYQVFAVKGYNVAGMVETNLSLQGVQSDATNGRYNKLNNNGTLTVKDLTLKADMFPLPFNITNGTLSFKQDKIWLDAFRGNYGKSDFKLTGYVNNIINYALADNETLQGKLSLSSNQLVADELMAYASGTDSAAIATADSTGVIIIPANLQMDMQATANKVNYNGLNLTNVKAQLLLNKGTLTIKNTGFTLINTPIEMSGSYTSVSPTKASFNYHIKASNFDIHKAYTDIQLFHDMASAAAKVKGQVSLDYTLKGNLDANMYPVYPTLKGGGTLTLEKVQVSGLKLFSAVSKATNRDSINNPNLEGVKINTIIANNIITIQRTKMRVFGFRPRLEGQVSFDGNLNLRFRLGLPPLGVFGIPMSITGTQDNPIIKMRQASDADNLEETAPEE
ncbi:AsmA family protein [Limnovirga soli]|uniref:AsmA family protein n=1 Tax=Limnovirga soli TaxID=2656915 RepID=A0A8J8JR76_9BACT|nr:AsmA-like C-terminal region-containing protein [Limnovirga soli]NNV55562.1 AsmA family protein [Limnovirga soli]